ncbi:MAG: radical SAM protein [Deltaproteobacteria bacterium]|nr:radical SAM protein [Deltaproteobacteria bacterium]
MRFLFICPNRQKFVHPVPPIGPLYLAAALNEHGHEVRLVDLMFSRHPLAEIESAVREFSPEVVGISIRNVDTLFSKEVFELQTLKEYVLKIREWSKAMLFLGGAGFSIFPRELFQELEADYGIAGEADESLPLLLERLEQGQDPSNIAGLVFKQGTEVVVNPLQLVTELDRIPFQAIDLIDARMYAKRRGNLGVFTRRGCPLDCIYCPEAPLYGHACRLRSHRRVVDELEYILQRTGVPYFDFADTLFNLPSHHAMAVCQEIVDRRVKIKFEVELNPIGQNEESVKLLKAAGVIGVDLTADAGSDEMLHNLNKGFTREMLLNVAKLYAKYKIPYTVGYLLGGPGENLQTVNETLEFTRRLPGCSAVYFAVGIRVFRGTRLENLLLERGAIGQPDDLLPLNFYYDSGFDQACADRLMEEYRQNLNYYLCDLFYEPFFDTLLNIIGRLNVRPLWKHGRAARILQKILHLGRIPVYWNEAGRHFQLSPNC